MKFKFTIFSSQYSKHCCSFKFNVKCNVLKIRFSHCYQLVFWGSDISDMVEIVFRCCTGRFYSVSVLNVTVYKHLSPVYVDQTFLPCLCAFITVRGFCFFVSNLSAYTLNPPPTQSPTNLPSTLISLSCLIYWNVLEYITKQWSLCSAMAWML